MDKLASSDFEMGRPDTVDDLDDDEKPVAPFNTNDYYADYIMNLYRKF